MYDFIEMKLTQLQDSFVRKIENAQIRSEGESSNFEMFHKRMQKGDAIFSPEEH